MSDDEKKHLTEVMEALLPKESKYNVKMDNLGPESAAIVITQSEFMRRYRDMAAIGGGMNFYGEIPDTYNITVNAQNPVIEKIKASEQGLSADNKLLKQVTDLALLANGMLKGKDLAEFIKRSEELL
jgi:molecular chaperone HtpG